MTDFEAVGDDSYVVSKLPFGNYEIHMTWGPGYGEPRQNLHLMAAITDHDVDLGTVNVGSLRTITGRIIGSAEVRQKMKTSGLTLARWDSTLLSTHAAIADDGSLSVDLPEGGYRIVAQSLPSDLYLAYIRDGSRDLLDTGLMIDGDPLGTIDISIASGTSIIEGTVRNDKGELLAGAHVILLPTANRRTNPDLFFTVVTNTAGTFSISKVPPGSYSVLALESLPPDAQWDAEFMMQFQKFETRISIGESDRRTIDIPITSNFK
jgi:hypothetical protein